MAQEVGGRGVGAASGVLLSASERVWRHLSYRSQIGRDLVDVLAGIDFGGRWEVVDLLRVGR